MRESSDVGADRNQDRLYQDLAPNLLEELGQRISMQDRAPIDSLLFATEERQIAEARNAAQVKRDRFARATA